MKTDEISKADYALFEKEGIALLKSYAEFDFNHDSFITGYKSGRVAERNEPSD